MLTLETVWLWSAYREESKERDDDEGQSFRNVSKGGRGVQIQERDRDLFTAQWGKNF